MIDPRITHIVNRAPWRAVASPILKSVGIHVMRGTEPTLAALDGVQLNKQQRDALERSLLELRICGEKMVRAYKVTGAQRNAMSTWAAAKRRRASALTDAWPGVAAKTAIVAASADPARFVNFHEHDEGYSVLFTASRSFNERVKIQPTGALAQFDEVIGIRRVHVQTFDAIWIPKQGNYIFVAADFPDEAPVEFPIPSVIALEHGIGQALGNRLPPINFWKCIDGLYYGHDGKFVEHGFVTGGHIMVHHARTSDRNCLRRNHYHVGGATAVDNELENFRAAVQWKRNATFPDAVTSPEAHLRGTATALHAAPPTLLDVVVRNCAGVEDLDFVLKQLLPYL